MERRGSCVGFPSIHLVADASAAGVVDGRIVAGKFDGGEVIVASVSSFVGGVVVLIFVFVILVVFVFVFVVFIFIFTFFVFFFDIFDSVGVFVGFSFAVVCAIACFGAVYVNERQREFV